MKIFLLKLLLFLGVITIGLVVAYRTLDSEEKTIGDFRYVKARNVFKRKDAQYNTLLVGSSRVMNLGDSTIGPHRIYNFGLLGGMPNEYARYIAWGRENQPIKTVVLALDFYGTAKKGLKSIENVGVLIRDPHKYINDVKAETPVTAFATIFDFPRFKRLVNAQLYPQTVEIADPDNKVWVRKQWAMYEIAYAHYELDPDLAMKYDSIKTASGDADLRVFVTPVTRPLFELMQQNNLEGQFQNFLRLLVKTYGTVYNFMELNEFTSSPRNFVDENHLSTPRLFEVVQFMTGEGQASNLRFTKLDASNIDYYIDNKLYLAGTTRNSAP